MNAHISWHVGMGEKSDGHLLFMVTHYLFVCGAVGGDFFAQDLRYSCLGNFFHHSVTVKLFTIMNINVQKYKLMMIIFSINEISGSSISGEVPVGA